MKKFKGFTPDQQFVLLQNMGYTGPKDQSEMNKFIMSSPSAQARLGKFAEMAQKKLGKEPMNMATGGAVSLPDQQSADELNEAQQAYSTAVQTSGITSPEAQTAAESLQKANTAFSVTNVPSAKEATAQAVQTPTAVVTPANIATITQSPDQLIPQGTGTAGTAPQVGTATVSSTAQAAVPDKPEVVGVDPTISQPDVQTALDGMEAATADPTAKATVRGQLEMLMQDFEGGGTPPWASGAMRQAMGIMQQRGLGASSMAGAAVVQAAMESAIGIASQDASTQAQFEMQNLNNQQQTAIFKTQQRIASIFTDQAAQNAAKQFNAASENQVNQFFADMQSTVSRFNADQVNAIRQFNAGQTNATSQFNASVKAAREEFNAKNDLIISQANTQWRQNIATLDTAAQNAANMDFARTANSLTARALDQIWQEERDIMNFAFASTESANQRKHELVMGNKSIKAAEDSANKEAIGYVVGRLLFG